MQLFHHTSKYIILILKKRKKNANKISDLKLNNITPHKKNPVIIDSKKARNAGNIFEKNGKLNQSVAQIDNNQQKLRSVFVRNASRLVRNASIALSETLVAPKAHFISMGVPETA